MSDPKQTTTELHVTARSGGRDREIRLSGDLGIHDDPKKLAALLDLLEVPKGTEVRVITTAASVLVR